MKGEIADNYIHNCLWSGILATGSHNLRIHKNKISFTVPKKLSISVGIWTTWYSTIFLSILLTVASSTTLGWLLINPIDFLGKHSGFITISSV